MLNNNIKITYISGMMTLIKKKKIESERQKIKSRGIS